MPRDHFSKRMFSPYFQSKHYQETAEAQNEEKVWQFFVRIKNKFLRKK